MSRRPLSSSFCAIFFIFYPDGEDRYYHFRDRVGPGQNRITKLRAPPEEEIFINRLSHLESPSLRYMEISSYRAPASLSSPPRAHIPVGTGTAVDRSGSFVPAIWLPRTDLPESRLGSVSSCAPVEEERCGPLGDQGSVQVVPEKRRVVGAIPPSQSKIGGLWWWDEGKIHEGSASPVLVGYWSPQAMHGKYMKRRKRRIAAPFSVEGGCPIHSEINPQRGPTAAHETALNIENAQLGSAMRAILAAQLYKESEGKGWRE
ncbi:hypothetical protein DFH09DRAFT_1080194 [Mycena vulgaris]|nr:hypothetical protein DFH09DRAFT_1080194 [Mycena vulgaris]